MDDEEDNIDVLLPWKHIDKLLLTQAKLTIN